VGRWGIGGKSSGKDQLQSLIFLVFKFRISKAKKLRAFSGSFLLMAILIVFENNFDKGVTKGTLCGEIYRTKPAKGFCLR
jgi:hypothetical protein